MTSNKNNDYLHISEIDTSKFVFKLKPTDPKKQEYDQTIYVNYEAEKQSLSFQTSAIELFGKGLGYTHSDYVKEEKDKAVLKIPINESDSESLIKLNEYLKSNEFKNIFGKAMNKFRIKNIIKINDDDDTIPNKITVKIKYEGNNKTKIYQGLDEDNEITYDSIDEFQKIIRYGGTYIFVITVARIWAKKSSLAEPDYGITFRVDKVYIIKSVKQNSSKTNKTLNLKYISNEIIQENEIQKSNSKSSSSNKKTVLSESDDDNESDDSDDVKKKRKQPVARRVVDSDAETDEEFKKSQLSVTRRVVDSDAESDEQELKPKAKARSKSKK